VIICGFGPIGSTVANFISHPSMLTSSVSKETPVNYLGFDLDPEEVISSYKSGYRIMYGDGSQPSVLMTAGIEAPRAFVVTYTDIETNNKAVERLHQAFPNTPIFSIAYGKNQYFNLISHGARHVIQDERESSFGIASLLLKDIGVKQEDIDTIAFDIRSKLENEDTVVLKDKVELIKRKDNKDSEIEWETDVVSSMRNRVNLMSDKAAKNFVKFISNGNRVVVDDSGKETITEDSSAVEILDVAPASLATSSSSPSSAPVLTGESASSSSALSSGKIENIEDVSIEDLGVTVCILPKNTNPKS